MKVQKTEQFIQVVCKDLKSKLKSLATFPHYAFERKWVGNEIILFFYILK
jgi:hypothetical protein